MVYFTQISGAKPCIVFLYWLADRNLPFMDCNIHKNIREYNPETNQQPTIILQTFSNYN